MGKNAPLTTADSIVRVIDLIDVDGRGGGADAIVLRTAASAAFHHFRTTVCCLRTAGDPHFDMDRRARTLGIDYCEIVEHSRLDHRVLPKLQEVVRDRQVVIVHAHGYKPAFYAYRLARATGVIPVSTLHGWTGRHWRERFLYYPAHRLIVRTFPLAIAVSNQIRDTLIRWGCRPERVRVLLNGINPREFRREPETVSQTRTSLGVAPGDVVLGAVGRLERQKRFDILLNAFAHMVQTRPNLRLFIAGDGTLRESLENQIRRLELSGRCRLLGHRDDVVQLYQGFDMLVQSSDYEGTPTVVVEAMAMEVPVVATDAGGTRQLIDDGVHGLIVPLRDPVALTKAIEHTLDDHDATTKRVAAARQRVETELSFDARMGQLDEIYRGLLNSVS